MPELLTPTPGSDAEKQISEFKKSYFATLEANAVFAKEAVDAIPGLELSIPQGAMYAMVCSVSSLHICLFVHAKCGYI